MTLMWPSIVMGGITELPHFNYTKKQNSCKNNLTHHCAQLPSTSKQLKLKVGTARRSLESRGLQMWLPSLSMTEMENLFIVATETLQLSDQNIRAMWLIHDREDLPPRLTWGIRTLKADVGLASFSLALPVFPNSTLHLLLFLDQYSKTLWCNASTSDSSSDSCVFKSHQDHSLLEEVFSFPAWWTIILN